MCSHSIWTLYQHQQAKSIQNHEKRLWPSFRDLQRVHVQNPIGSSTWGSFIMNELSGGMIRSLRPAPGPPAAGTCGGKPARGKRHRHLEILKASPANPIARSGDTTPPPSPETFRCLIRAQATYSARRALTLARNFPPAFWEILLGETSAPGCRLAAPYTPTVQLRSRSGRAPPVV